MGVLICAESPMSSGAHGFRSQSNGWVGLEVLPHGRDVERTGDPEGPWERSAPVSEVDAGQDGVHGGAPAGQATGEVDGEDTTDHDDT